jgi:hypothetical protein
MTKISKPGVYQMTLEEYHSDNCIGPSISSSGLRAIELQSPAHYWMDSYLNPEREPRDEKPHFALGSAAHTLFLGEDHFRQKYRVRPEKWDSWRTADAKEWREACWDKGLSVLEPKDMVTILGMAKSLAAHPLVAKGLLSGAIEQSLIWQDELTGVWLKIRPDAIPDGANMATDLKTCADASARAVRESIFKYGYHMQMALTTMGIKAVLGREINDEDCSLLFVETKPPYCVNFKPLEARAIYYGRRQIRRAINKFAECLERGEWPGYDDDCMAAFMPKYMMDRLEDEGKASLLPEVE